MDSVLTNALGPGGRDRARPEVDVQGREKRLRRHVGLSGRDCPAIVAAAAPAPAPCVAGIVGADSHTTAASSADEDAEKTGGLSPQFTHTLVRDVKAAEQKAQTATTVLDVGANTSQAGRAAGWTCSACTCANETDTVTCSVCWTRRPRSSADCAPDYNKQAGKCSDVSDDSEDPDTDDGPGGGSKLKLPKSAKRAAGGGGGSVPKASRYRGVSERRAASASAMHASHRNAIKHTWEVRVVNGGKATYVGSFEDEVEAARAYDRVAVELKGAKARLNFPTQAQKDEGATRYKGVSQLKAGSGRWRAVICSVVHRR